MPSYTASYEQWALLITHLLFEVLQLGEILGAGVLLLDVEPRQIPAVGDLSGVALPELEEQCR